MTAAPSFDLPEALRAELGRLHGLGFSLLPLGGADGKSPLRRAWTENRATLSQVLGPLYGSGSRCYGIRLEGLTVLDCDTDDASLVVKLEARFGASPVHVKTPRGRHLYYGGEARPNLKAEGIPVDVKSGPNQYVVGPGSVRPDGGQYVARRGTLGACDLPRLHCLEEVSACVPVGARNGTLWTAAIVMVEYVESEGELCDNLTFLRDENFANPATVSDAEVRKVARWAWKIRCENNVYAGRASAFRIDREAVAALGGSPDALALYTVLVGYHGHQPGKTFGLSSEGMRASGLIDLSRERFLAARRALENAGLLEVAQGHRKGVHCRHYCLTRPVQPLSDDLLRLRTGKRQGEGL